MSVISTDPIADMLTRIRNAAAVRKTEVNMPHSKLKQAVAELLRDNGFIDDVHTTDAAIGKTLTITISGEHENSRITEIVRLSKPGRRHYVNAKEIPVVKRGRGVVVISTSQGLMTGTKAKELGIGGELICKVF